MRSTLLAHSRMRSAKGFFLPFFVAEYVHYHRRPPTGRQPAGVGPLFAESIGSPKIVLIAKVIATIPVAVAAVVVEEIIVISGAEEEVAEVMMMIEWQ